MRAALVALLTLASLAVTAAPSQKLADFQPCAAPTQCQSNLCVEHQCVPALLPFGVACKADQECQGRICHKEANSTSGGVCAFPGQKTFTRANFQPCNANAQCASGVCDAELQGCVPPGGLLPGFRATNARFCASGASRMLDLVNKVASCTTPSGSGVLLLERQRCRGDANCRSGRCGRQNQSGPRADLLPLLWLPSVCIPPTGLGAGQACTANSDCQTGKCAPLAPGFGVCSASATGR